MGAILPVVSALGSAASAISTVKSLTSKGPKAPALPAPVDSSKVAAEAAEDERRAASLRRGRQSTILTPLLQPVEAGKTTKDLLGS